MVEEDHIEEVATLCGVLEEEHDYLEKNFRERCDHLMEAFEEITNKNYVQSYLNLKEKFM